MRNLFHFIIQFRQEARGKRQEARGKREQARGKRQEGTGEIFPPLPMTTDN
ncbi:MAG: hypothetical protein HEQ13_18080 [Dolichospermum sp. DEX189]|nr:hypothetical protein [Dolichospermum sp. DEX189]